MGQLGAQAPGSTSSSVDVAERRGLGLPAAAAIAGVGLVVGVGTAALGWTSDQGLLAWWEAVVTAVLSLGMAVGCLVVAARILTERFRCDARGVTWTRWFRRHELRWAEVDAVGVLKRGREVEALAVLAGGQRPVRVLPSRPAWGGGGATEGDLEALAARLAPLAAAPGASPHALTWHLPTPEPPAPGVLVTELLVLGAVAALVWVLVGHEMAILVLIGAGHRAVGALLAWRKRRTSTQGGG